MLFTGLCCVAVSARGRDGGVKCSGRAADNQGSVGDEHERESGDSKSA